MAILSSKKGTGYKKSWKVVDESVFDEHDLKIIERITVVKGDYHLSCAVETSEEVFYYSLSAQQSFPIGKQLDPEKCIILTLQRGVSFCEKLYYVEDEDETENESGEE